MAHQSILDAKTAALVVVDYQEAFRGFIDQFELVTPAIVNAVKGFGVLGLPVIVTEQYPKGLGHTISEVDRVLPDSAKIIEKTAFSSCGAAGFENGLREKILSQVVLCGIETHICVNQTAHDLLDNGFQVHVLTDAVGSRFSVNKEAGLRKMFASGAIPSSVEMALFELMRDSKHACFKDIQGIVK
ncbi:MAG: isochorismatase family protein [Acidobacteriota bacterium]|nr:MAG: isochorismatase family protein [Acidobacteriota bacterium]